MTRAEVFVRLLNEGVDAWRPVLADYAGGDRYRIVDQPYDREHEEWEFEPGDSVICQMLRVDDGPIHAAVARAT